MGTYCGSIGRGGVFSKSRRPKSTHKNQPPATNPRKRFFRNQNHPQSGRSLPFQRRSYRGTPERHAPISSTDDKDPKPPPQISAQKLALVQPVRLCVEILSRVAVPLPIFPYVRLRCSVRDCPQYHRQERRMPRALHRLKSTPK